MFNFTSFFPALLAILALVCFAGSGVAAPTPAVTAVYDPPTLTGRATLVRVGTEVHIHLQEEARAKLASGFRGTPIEYLRGTTTIRRDLAGLKADLENGACVLRTWRSDYTLIPYPGLLPCVLDAEAP